MNAGTKSFRSEDQLCCVCRPHPVQHGDALSHNLPVGEHTEYVQLHELRMQMMNEQRKKMGYKIVNCPNEALENRRFRAELLGLPQ